MIGIPYAYSTINAKGELELTCPECGAKIVEQTDQYGEETTSNYAEHYEAEHEEG